jgi:alkane 1-monooxygenase
MFCAMPPCYETTMPSRKSLPAFAFAAATLIPLGLLAAGGGFGGGWAELGLIYMTLLVAGLDQIKGAMMGNAPEGAEFPGADPLLIALGAAHMILLPCMVYAIAGPSELALWPRVALFAGAGLWFGQVSVPAAHELIHRSLRGLNWLGVAIYGTLIFGHHASSHRLVHHAHAASAADPNSARADEGFYRFYIRAWTGSFAKGLAAENALRARKQGPQGLHPYLVYVGLGVAGLAVGYLIAGLAGLLVWAGLSSHAQVQLLLSDYVQHYGLRRATLANGKLEPMAERHSWNAPHWFSSALMLNSPRHSDHHTHPARPFPALRLPPTSQAPTLPYPLPVACVLALAPPYWKRAMAPRLAPWQHR